MSNTTYLVTTANTRDGAVHGHKAGCADLKRSKDYVGCRDQQFTVEVASKQEAREEYNADFDEATDGWYDIEWMPCANHVPLLTAPEVEIETIQPKPKAKRSTKKAAAPKLEMKNTGKYTRFYVDGKEVSYVPNELAAEIAKLLTAN